jgi:hypothetical protein
MDARIVSPASAQGRTPANKEQLLVQWINKKLLWIKQELQKYTFWHSLCEFCIAQPQEMHLHEVGFYDWITCKVSEGPNL